MYRIDEHTAVWNARRMQREQDAQSAGWCASAGMSGLHGRPRHRTRE